MVDSESDTDDPESEDDDVIDPYPIDGRYKDEDDRLRYDSFPLPG
jgi:RNA polymerase-associated protein RTF1